MVPVMRKKIFDIPAMGDIALPGSGKEELCAGFFIFFQKENRTTGLGRLNRAEQSGGSGTNYRDIVQRHGSSLPVYTVSICLDISKYNQD